MTWTDIQKLNEPIEEISHFLSDVRKEINKVIVGQEKLVDRVLIALLADGHILLEGVPGLAKTLLVKTVQIRFKPLFHASSLHRIYCRPI